jgi:hypothetical protein
MWNGTNWIVLSDNCFPQPTVANAGLDQSFNDNTLTTTLAANTPTEGVGTWSVISPTGTTTSFSDIHSPHATFTGEACTNYQLRWTITTTCASTYDEVYIRFNQQPTLANAGPNQYFSDATTSTTLAANTPTVGIGTWYIDNSTIGTIANFSDIHDPNATFTGNPCTAYNLYWKITACTTSQDSVFINFSEQPTVSNAGNTIYSLSSTTVTLAANTPTSGTGTWSIYNGGTGTFANVNDPNTTFTADNNNTHYILRWTISACTNSITNVDVYIGNVVGQFAYGGVIFYVDNTGNHGLVCATVESNIKWSCTYANISTSTAVGTGQSNTTNIVADQSTCSAFAAKYCNNLVSNGYNDWFLPSLFELRTHLFINRYLVNQTLQNIGGTPLNFTTTGIYWSSSQYSTSAAYKVNFINGAYGPYSKGNPFYVRPVRAF